MSSTQIFLQIEFERGGLIKGGSVADGFEEYIEIASFRWGMKVSGDISNVRKGRPLFEQLKLSKSFDTASIGLLNCMRTRDRIKGARLTVTHGALAAGTTMADRTVMTVEFSSGFLTNIDLDVNESGKEVSIDEDLEFSFTELDVKYFPPTTVAGGKRAAPMTFDLVLDTAEAEYSGMAGLFD